MRSRDGGNGSCPLPAELEQARAARGEHNCSSFKAFEVIASTKVARALKGRAQMAERQEGLF